MLNITALKKLKAILTKKEIIGLFKLILGSIILSLSEVFSIGIVIPIMILFVSPEKIHANTRLNFLYNLSGASSDKDFFVMLVIFAITLFVLKNAYSIFVLYKQQNVIGNIHLRLTNKALHSYLVKPYSFYLVNNTSILFKNVNSEISYFANGLLTPFLILVSEAIIFFGIFLFLLLTYPLATGVLICIFGIVMTLTGFFIKKKIVSYSIAREKCGEQTYKTALESLTAVKEIKVYSVYDFFIQRFSGAYKEYLNAFVKFNVISGLPRYILETVFFVVILLFLLGCILLHKSFSDIVPMMTLVGMASLRILPSVNRIYSNINQFHYNSRSLDIVYDILKEDQISPVTNPVGIRPVNQIENPDQSIMLQDITFKYDSANKPIFENLDLTIPLCHTVAFVGATGAGKSTLIDILMGLLTPSEGRLLYKQSVIVESNVLDYRKKIGYVPQQIFLIDDTLEANIAFGVPREKIDYKRIKEVIEIVQFKSLVTQLPQGVKTEIGERGIRLSGGQRQRVGIARALYRNPEILIMDEATSSLDVHTELEIAKALKELSGKLTVIIIAHRLSTIQQADIIYVVEKGNIVAQGNFIELSNHSPVFKKITNQKICI